MINQFKNEKGLTIIEVVMSLAILMIIMVSVSGVVSIVLKNKDFAEQKQTASLLGQQILEEIQLIDTLRKHQTEDKYYVPLAGVNDLIKEEVTNTLVGTYKASIKGMNVELNLGLTELTSDDSTLENPSITDFIVNLEGTNNDITFSSIGSGQNTLSKDDVLQIIYDSERITVKNRKTGSEIGSSTIGENPVIQLNLLEGYKMVNDLMLEIINKDNAQTLKLQILKHENSTGGIEYVQAPIGLVNIETKKYNDLSPVGNLYEFELTISQSNRKLFELYGTKNFIKQN